MHRQPALQVVRFVLQDRWPNRITNHRLMDVNIHPWTTFEYVKLLFDVSELRVQQEVNR